MVRSIDHVAIIGAGRLGAALIKALAELSQFRISAIIDNNRIHAEKFSRILHDTVLSDQLTDLAPVDTIFIAAPDDAIQSVADELTQIAKKTKIANFVFHMSGSLPSDVLDNLKRYQIEIGSMHPVQSFSGLEDDERRLKNIYFGLEGTENAIDRMAQFVKILHSHYILIPGEAKPLYHLACTIASNYMVALVKPVIEIFEKMGYPETESKKIFFPLVYNSLENIMERSVNEALTGPIARGDEGTIEKHIQILRKFLPAYEDFYRELGKIALDFESVRSKLSAETTRKIRQLLNDKDENDD